MRNNMNAMKHIQLTACLMAAFCLSGCEGFKFITVENKSKDSITIVAHPGIETPELVEYPNTYQGRTDTIVTLPPDSTLRIPVYFGPVNVFDKKVKEENIKFDFFKVLSKKDTLVANNKKELYNHLKRRGNVGRITIR